MKSDFFFLKNPVSTEICHKEILAWFHYSLFNELCRQKTVQSPQKKSRQQKNIIKIFLVVAMLFKQVCAVKPALIPTFHSHSGYKTRYCWKSHWFKAFSSFVLLAITKDKSTQKAQLPACALTFCPSNIPCNISGWLIHNTYLIKSQCRVEVFPHHNHKLLNLLFIGCKAFCQLILFQDKTLKQVWG